MDNAIAPFESDVENRSEIVFLYDAEDTNPNGNPLSGNNRPRVDEDSGQAEVTVYRLKRYLRDQLYDDNEGVYLVAPNKAAINPSSRDDLFLRLLDKGADEVSEMEPTELFDAFVNAATDVRYFGAPLSFNGDVQDALDRRPAFTGPVQFDHGRSLNEVVRNDESRKLSVTVTSGDNDETGNSPQQGTFAEDNRLRYALVRFHGVVNENAADNTQLRLEDVERLDTLCWRALKNQTLTNSKMGHSPRLYLRVEFEPQYHEGHLDALIDIDTDESEPDAEMRNISHVVLDVSDLLTRLTDIADRIISINVRVDQYVTINMGDGPTDRDDLYDRLRNIADTNVVEVY
jgi:CRISPR-associated protein Csh2